MKSFSFANARARRLFGLLAVLFFSCLLPGNATAQTYTISGTIIDEAESFPVPLVPVLIISLDDTTRKTGVNSDLDGRFRISLPKGRYQLVIDYVGYNLFTTTIELTQNLDQLQYVLENKGYEVQEVTVSAKDNPANRLMKQIIEGKQQHRISQIPGYSFESYNKLVIFLNDLDTADLDGGILNRARSLILEKGLDTLRSSDSAGARYKLAIYISETIAENYYEQPDNKKEIIKGSRSAGVSSDVNLSIVSSLFAPFDVYENNINIASRSFVSPLADGALQNYDYYIEKTIRTPNDTTYYIGLYPKNPYDRAFKGVIVISTHDMVVKSASLRLNRDPLINFVKDIRISQQFEKIDGKWLLTVSDMQIDIIDIFLGKGATARQAQFRRNYNLEPKYPPKYFQSQQLETLQGASNRDVDFWKQNQLAPLDKSELLAFEAGDTLRKAFFWQATDLAIDFLLGGTLNLGTVFLGPYSKSFGFNQVEGIRLQLGVYTNPEVFNRWDVGVYGAYGFNDRRFKYYADVGYAISLKPRIEIAVRRIDDIEQTGFDNYFAEGLGFLNSVLQRVQLNNLNYYTLNQFRITADITQGVAAKASITQKLFAPAPLFPFQYPSLSGEVGADSLRNYNTTEVTGELRLSVREKYNLKGGRKVYLHTPFPVLYIKATQGLKGTLNGDFDYTKVELALTNRYNLTRLGRITFTVQYGKIWGDLPYPTLRVFQGSQSYGGYTLGSTSDLASSVTGRTNISVTFPPINYNLMYFYEFVADEYLQAGFDWYLDGYIIKKLPLIRALKVKEVVTFRTAYGTLTANNKANNNVGDQPVQAPDKQPYTELSFGLDNILKFIRVDYVFRLNYLNPQTPSNVPTGNYNGGFRFHLHVAF